MIKQTLSRLLDKVVSRFRETQERKLNDIHAFQKLAYSLSLLEEKIELHPGGYAAGPTMLYETWRIFDLIKPAAVLELGSGQSTKLAWAYAGRNPDSKIFSVEDESFWLEAVRDMLPGVDGRPNFRLVHAPLEKRLKVSGVEFDWYGGDAFEQIILDQKFDLIIVDGPSGRKKGARLGVASILPECLSDNFVILVDDAESEHVKQLIDEVAKRLEGKRDFREKIIRGENSQVLFCSAGLTSLITGTLVDK